MRKRSFLFTVLCLALAAAGNAFCQDAKEDAETYYRLGKVYYDQGRYKESEELFQKSVNILSKLQEKKESQPSRAAERAVKEPGAAQRAGAQMAQLRQEYLIGDEDVLHITVWQNPDLETEVIVRPDGMVSCPLIGDVPASGMSVTQLTRDMTQRFGEYVRDPQVSISIRKIGGKRVIILGQVVQPGIVSAGGAMRVMDAIGMAGGFTKDAVPSSTVIIRGGFVGAKAQKLNLSKVFKGDLHDNIDLQSQDIIFVPKKFIADLNYFLEQVLDPLSRGIYTTKELQTW
jgi:polysaccharide biosynthesis/export protein